MSASALNTIVLFEAISGGEVAQSVEQRTENPRVHSSILCLATIFFCLQINPANIQNTHPISYSGFFWKTRLE